MTREETHRLQLVRCQVQNASGEHSLRFIEHSHYRLWQYMMANKHGIRVHHATVCLWLPEQEWRTQEQLFSQHQDATNVHRINLAVFDSANALCNTVQRFVPESDSEFVRELLLKRLPDDVKASGDYALEIEGGHCIAKPGPADLVTLGNPLSAVD